MKKAVKKLILALASLGICLSLSAQTTTISGTVTDEKGEPLIGVGVLVQGSTLGTTSLPMP